MKKNRDPVCFNQFLLILPWSSSWFQHGTQPCRAADRGEICLINLFWTEHGRASFRMQTGFMDNMLSVFPPRPERLLCPGPKRCQAVSTESAVREGVNKVSCLQLGRWGERGQSLQIFIPWKELLILNHITVSYQRASVLVAGIFISNSWDIFVKL